MGDGFLGEIRLFGGNFNPRQWAFCEGQLLPIAQNTALFSIIGTIYGGDGRTTFKLPDLRGRTAIGAGRGPGLSDRRLGSMMGVEEVTLNVTQIPNHTHTISNKAQATTEPVDKDSPANSMLPATAGIAAYADGNNLVNMETGSVQYTVGGVGGGQSHTNKSPRLGINYIICLQGTFPSRS